MVHLYQKQQSIRTVTRNNKHASVVDVDLRTSSFYKAVSVWVSSTHKKIQLGLKNRCVRALLNVLVTGGIFFLLIDKLLKIGWKDIASTFPTSPLFYLLSFGLFYVVSISDMLAAQTIMGRKIENGLKLFSRKHVINKSVFSYVGEAYLVKKIANLPDFNMRETAIAIKDSNLVRTFVANLWVILMILLAIAFGSFNIFSKVDVASSYLLFSILAMCVSICLAITLFYNKITNLSLRVTGQVALIYFFRSVLVAILQISQWGLALPAIAMSTWFLFLVVYAISKKSPFSGDLVFVLLILTLPVSAQGASAMASMLIAASAIQQVVYLVVFILTSEFNFKRLAFLRS